MKILNFGSLNLDYVYSVPHIVCGGETISSDSFVIQIGGKGLNQSIALARAGACVYHAGFIGEDGNVFFKVCEENGIHTGLIRKLSGKSGHTIIQVDENGENSIILYGGSNQKNSVEYITEVMNTLEAGDYVIFQNEVNLLKEMIDCAYERGARIVLNPSPINEKVLSCDLAKVSLFLLNEIEGEQLTGEKGISGIIKKMLELYPKAEFVLTLGKEGSVYFSNHDKYCCKGYKVEAIDTTAAGDTFTGYYLEEMLRGKPIKECLDFASAAAAIAVTREGAVSSIPLREQVIRFLDIKI